ncbi:Uncharacterised protein [Rhodococcus wratislaviensis]|uniref:Uncharacterized protein n=1 Tax=Rhodococcus wratislaviensis TaxID=44752 RepID=A0AB38F5Z2_RHOWR|nr:Uncharacterised protein [Rhodococcus wratislaviensis]
MTDEAESDTGFHRVQDHGVTAFDHPVTGLVVRIGAVGSGSDDGEIKLLVPESAQQPRQLGCDLAFTPTGERRLHDVLMSEMPYLPAGSSSAPATGYGSVPSAHSTSDTAAVPSADSASGRSSAGTTMVGIRSGHNTKIVRRSVIAVGDTPPTRPGQVRA